MGLVINARNVKNTDLQDEIFSGLLRESLTAKEVLARRLQQGAGGPGTTVAFDEMYDIGEGAANALTAVVLDPSAWSSEESRRSCEEDVFQLYLAKLLEVGHDNEGRAMKGIARLLAQDAPRLYKLLDEETFEIILSALDYRNPVDIKSRATLATAKFLEVSPAAGQKYLTNFVTSQVGKAKHENLIMAFSAAAAVFPVACSVAAELFLVEGFLPSLIPLLERKVKSRKVEHAALEMLSAACLDSACREAINKHCLDWLRQTLDKGEDERSGLAAVTLAKLANPHIQDNQSQTRYEDRLEDLVSRLRGMLLDHPQGDEAESIEGLAYASANPKVKEKLINDSELLRKLLKDLSNSKKESMTAFGCLSLIHNLSRYLPNLSQEQKKVAELKAYANSSKPSSEPDPLDQEPAVTRRCKVLIDAGTVSTISTIGKTLSPASITLVFNILLALSWPQSHRGIIAQQGGAKLLLQLYTRITSTSPESVRARQTAAHALARILISIDPVLVFPASSHPSVVSTIRPIVSLLSDDIDGEGPRDLLPTFEALLALANLLVAPTPAVADLIVRLALQTLESLILHDNVSIRRATTQVITNLVQHPVGVNLFADESDAAGRRLHVLLALSGTEDLETRKAAGGALAMLTESEGCVKSILGMDRGVFLLCSILEDSEEDMLHRGVVCVANLATAPEPLGTLAKDKLKAQDVHGKLKKVEQGPKSMDLLGVLAQLKDILGS